jgi:hypothetical protein
MLVEEANVTVLMLMSSQPGTFDPAMSMRP